MTEFRILLNDSRGGRSKSRSCPRSRRSFWDQFESASKVGDEDTVWVGFGASGAPFVEPWIHLGDVVCFGAGVFGEVDPTADVEYPLIEIVKKRPDSGLDWEVKAEHEAAV